MAYSGVDLGGYLPEKTAEFYRAGSRILLKNKIEFLVGGAYAYGAYTGVERHTKDFDIFVRPADAQRALDALAEAGFRTEMTFPHWLGKAYGDDDFIDVIFCSGNGVAIVDDEWFEHAVEAKVLGLPLRLCPAEEIIWSKAFVDERERFDGADIVHLVRARGPELDWNRLLRRFDRRWRVLMSHLIMYGFVYPGERDHVPAEVMHELLGRLQTETDSPPRDEKLCQGTLISREQYLIDVHQWGYRDARTEPDVHMTSNDIAHWTNAIQRGKADHP